jgi:5'-nucleotidase
MTRSKRTIAIALVALALLAGACSDDNDSSADDTTTTGGDDGATSTTGGGDTLQILLTNDDGVGSEGIDALAVALSNLPDTEVTIVAPAENQSGSSDQTTDGALTTEETTTASGVEATAVDGFPADSVIWALDQGGIDVRPDLVVSGINEGQNVGPATALSGTVGAARTAARRGIPAYAASAGLVAPSGEGIVEYEDAVDLVVEWVEANREELLAAEDSDEPALVTNLNVPTCVTGELRGEVEVPIATDTGGINFFEVDCTSTLEDPADDVVALVNGFAAQSAINVTELDALITSVTGG